MVRLSSSRSLPTSTPTAPAAGRAVAARSVLACPCPRADLLKGLGLKLKSAVPEPVRLAIEGTGIVWAGQGKGRRSLGWHGGEDWVRGYSPTPRATKRKSWTERYGAAGQRHWGGFTQPGNDHRTESRGLSRHALMAGTS